MEICAVPIDWKMLTILRPKLKVDEDYFSKLIELGKAQIKTEAMDKKLNAPSMTTKKLKNKAGVIETRITTCPECSDEFCLGKVCMDFNYENFTRVPIKVPPKKPNEYGSNKSTSSIIASLTGTDKAKKVADKSKGKIKRRSKSPKKKESN